MTLVSPYGLATCVQCRQQITNRSPNPCTACRLERWLEVQRAVVPEVAAYVPVVDEANERDFWAGVPRCRYNRALRRCVVAWRHRRGAKA
jgi:hypothetical protein